MQKIELLKLVGQRLSGREPEDMQEFVSGEAALVQEGILEGKPFLPWFLSQQVPLELGEGEGLVPLPKGFLMADLEEGAFVFWDDGRRTEVRPMDLADARKEFSGRGQGSPRVYALEGEAGVRFFPEPDGEYTVVFSAFIRAKAWKSLGDAEDNLWLRHAADLFSAEVGKVCSEVLRDKDAYQLFSRRVEEGWRNLEHRHLERRLAGQALRF